MQKSKLLKRLSMGTMSAVIAVLATAGIAAATSIGADIISTGLKTGTTAANALVLQTYDVDGAAYTTFGTLTANNTPTFDLAAATTIGGSAILAASAIGSSVQAYNANLTTYAGIAPSTDVQSILGSANYAAVRSSLGLTVGTDVQAYDGDLSIYAAITPSSNVQTLLGSADFAAFKTSLGLNSVENTALSTWAGTTNITTLGTIATGTWNGTSIAIANGGTGATTANGALNALLPSQTGNAGKFLASDATDSAWTTLTSAMVGLGSVENTALSTWAGTTNITTLGTIATGTWNGTNIAANKLQATPADLGAANVTVDFGNSNGSFNTNIITDGSITAANGFTGYSVHAGIGGLSLTNQTFAGAGTDDTTAEWTGAAIVQLTLAGAAQTFNLGACASNANKIVTVLVTDTSAFPRTINGTNAEGIIDAGGVSANFSMQNSAVGNVYSATFYCDSFNWMVINKVVR